MANSMSPAAKLNQLIIDRTKTSPDYTVKSISIGTHQNTFEACVTCPIDSNGPKLSATGTGASKKEAKSEAATKFMEIHLRNRIELPNFLSRSSSTCSINVKEVSPNTVLQNFCAKMKLQQPEYREGEKTGPPHARNFKTTCIVSNFETEGEGSRKTEAKLNATMKMLEKLMQEKEVVEVFESPASTTATQPPEVICLHDNLRTSQCPTPIGIFARKSSTSSTPSNITTASNVSLLSIPLSPINTDTSIVIGVINHPAKVDKSASCDDSTMSLIDLSDDFESELEIKKEKSKSYTDLTGFSGNLERNLAVLRTAEQIDATLDNVEKQLYDEIRNKLGYGNSPREKSVVVLHHEFTVYIDNEPKPKICKGNIVCIDASIRIAVLAKLLMELKKHAFVTVTTCVESD